MNFIKHIVFWIHNSVKVAFNGIYEASDFLLVRLISLCLSYNIMVKHYIIYHKPYLRVEKTTM